MIQDLQKLGLTEPESKVYLAIVELGNAFVSSIAKRAKLNRSTCYHTLDNLVQKGLISSNRKGKITYYSAENTKKLLEITREKLQAAELITPQLELMKNTLAFKPKIRFFEGTEGIKSIFEDLLTTRGSILGYTNINDITKLFPTFFKKYCHQKVKQKIKTRYIAPLSELDIEILDEFYPKNYDPKLVELLLVNPDEFNFQNEIAIYDNKVAIMSLNPDETIGIIIESNTIAKSMKSFFDLAWLGATSFVAQ